MRSLLLLVCSIVSSLAMRTITTGKSHWSKVLRRSALHLMWVSACLVMCLILSF